MHYTIERVNKDEPFGDILDSMRRAGNDPGKAQAFALARQLAVKHPDSTVFVNEVISRDEENIIAAVNANDDVRSKYPEIEYLDMKKYKTLEKQFLGTVSREIGKGRDPFEVYDEIISHLHSAFETKRPVETASV
jgi:hypothetical protein